MLMRFSWRLGFPGWRIAARFGIPVKVVIHISRDSEVGVYFATSPDIGLAVESVSLDGLMAEIHCAMPELLEVAHSSVRDPRTDIRLHDDFVAA